MQSKLKNMKIKNGLTKENFFNDMQLSYPNSMREFCNFIDEYKEAVNWNDLFRNKRIYGVEPKTNRKFHDIPFEMQEGIILLFLKNKSESGYYSTDVKDRLQHWFHLNETLKAEFKTYENNRNIR